MKLTSPEFVHNGYIPREFTCQGEDVSPELNIEDVPEGTKSLTIIMDDLDAPVGTWVHWVVFDIAPTTTVIARNTIPGKQGINDFGKENYGGPCPPSGKHRYFFKLYALDKVLSEKGGISKERLVSAMGGHILAQTELIGFYEKVR